jgi:hypothetical protein
VNFFYLFMLNDISKPFFLEKSYLNESLSVMGKLDSSSCLQEGQLYSVSEISANSCRYFLLRQVTVQKHWSHKRKSLSLVFRLFSLVCILLIFYFAIVVAVLLSFLLDKTQVEHSLLPSEINFLLSRFWLVF